MRDDSAWARLFTKPAAAALTAVLIGLVFGGIIMILTGHDPLEAYREMVAGAFGGRDSANLVSTLNRATPIVGLGVAAAVAFRAGLFNLGLEGQLLMGGVAGAAVALYAPVPGPLLFVLTLTAGMLAGGLYALSTFLLDVVFDVPVLIGTLLLNFPARLFAAWLVASPMRQSGSSLSQTDPLPSAATIDQIPGLGGVHWGMLMIVLAAVGFWALIERSVIGYETQMIGKNPSFSFHGGLRYSGVGARTMMLSGGFAGLVGVIEVMAIHGRYVDLSLTRPLYAWTGVMAALLASSAIGPTVLAAVYFAALQNGGFGMERSTDVPREVSRVIQAVVILLVAVAARAKWGSRRVRHD